MSKTIIYLKSSDIALRHSLDEIINLEKGAFNINDLLGLKNLLDTLEEQILAEANATDHNALIEAIQDLVDMEISPSAEQESSVDSEYQLAISEYINTLSEEILNAPVPFTSSQYDKLIAIEKNLTKDIEKIIEKNEEISQKIANIKSSINITENITEELAEEAQEKLDSDKLELKANEKLVKGYENKIKGALLNQTEESTIETNISKKWASKYNINYGTYGDDLYDLIRLTNQINNLYGKLYDTSNFEAVQLFTDSIANTMSASPIEFNGESYNSFNDIAPENRDQILNDALDEVINSQDSEIVRDILGSYRAQLSRFSSDNYQFTEEELNTLRGLAESAENEVTRMNIENNVILAEIDEKTSQLEQNISSYEDKHGELPEINPIDDNQDPITNTEGISDIIDSINEIIKKELPYISSFEVTGNISEIGIQEDPRSRTLTIGNIDPGYHKEATFSIEQIDEDTPINAEINIENNQINITALGTGVIKFKVVTGEGDNKVKQIIEIPVEKNNIVDFDLEYDNINSMNPNDERTIIISNISPEYHKDPEFSYNINENNNSVEVKSFNNETGEITIIATGYGDVIFNISCGEITKEINIPVNKFISNFELVSNIENNELTTEDIITFQINNLEPQGHRQITIDDISISGPEGYGLTENDGIFTITYTPSQANNYNFIVTIDGISKNIEFIVKPAHTYVWYINKNSDNILGEESFVSGYNEEDQEDIISYKYNIDIDRLPVVESINQIYTDNPNNNMPYIDIEPGNKKIFIVCPTEWIDKFRLEDMSTLNIPLSNITNDYEIIGNMEGLSLLMQAAPMTSTQIKVLGFNNN